MMLDWKARIVYLALKSKSNKQPESEIGLLMNLTRKFVRKDISNLVPFRNSDGTPFHIEDVRSGIVLRLTGRDPKVPNMTIQQALVQYHAIQLVAPGYSPVIKDIADLQQLVDSGIVGRLTKV